jgi:hypothetical protein
MPNPDTRDSQEPPPILYKYLPEARIDILENLEFRFSRPSEFTDTFDTHYLVPKGQPKGIATRTRFRMRLGALCLTERADDHLMWVHYGQNHAGFVVGFNARSSFFTDDGRILRKVTYQERPSLRVDAT